MNKKDHQETAFRQAAAQYLDTYGSSLYEELQELEQSGQLFITPGLDKKVMEQIAQKRRQRIHQWLGLTAACLLLFVLVPLSLSSPNTAMEDSLGALESESGVQPAPSDVTSESPSPHSYRVVPLGFELPTNFTVQSYEQDKEKTIYYLSDSLLDDVVVTLQPLPADTSHFEALTRILINDSPAYAISTNTYHLLTFEDGEVLYTMTCQYDINTLVALGAQAI